MARDRGPFRTGERVLVPHTDKYYEAKVCGLMDAVVLLHFTKTWASCVALILRRF